MGTSVNPTDDLWTDAGCGSPSPISDGVYPIRVLATGITFNGTPFTREQALTAAVLNGGDQPLPTTPPRHSELCCLLSALTEDDSILPHLEQRGIDPNGIRKAIARCCAD